MNKPDLIGIPSAKEKLGGKEAADIVRLVFDEKGVIEHAQWV